MGTATDLEHVQFHYLHCCLSSLELGMAMTADRALSERKLRGILAEMRSECPECRRLGWHGWEAFD